jgi:hypothetical protein
MKLNAGQPIIENNGTMAQAFRTWTLQVSKSAPMLYAGTPEGNVIAEQYQFLINTSGTTGTLLYIKMQPDIGGDKSQGWVAV